jgi:hypothetical protein
MLLTTLLTAAITRLTLLTTLPMLLNTLLTAAITRLTLPTTLLITLRTLPTGYRRQLGLLLHRPLLEPRFPFSKVGEKLHSLALEVGDSGICSFLIAVDSWAAARSVDSWAATRSAPLSYSPCTAGRGGSANR